MPVPPPADWPNCGTAPNLCFLMCKVGSVRLAPKSGMRLNLSVLWSCLVCGEGSVTIHNLLLLPHSRYSRAPSSCAKHTGAKHQTARTERSLDEGAGVAHKTPSTQDSRMAQQETCCISILGFLLMYNGEAGGDGLGCVPAPHPISLAPSFCLAGAGI